MKLWGATYYMMASMVVQLMNKVPSLTLANPGHLCTEII